MLVVLVTFLLLLVIANAVTAAALVHARRRVQLAEQPGDEQVQAALAALARQGPATARTRQFISIELLNPIELAGSRGRLLGLAGSVAPGLTRRMVYDQTVKELKRQLVTQQVIADVHVHTVRPVAPAAPTTPAARTITATPANYVDEIDVPVQLPETDQPA